MTIRAGLSRRAEYALDNHKLLIAADVTQPILAELTSYEDRLEVLLAPASRDHVADKLDALFRAYPRVDIPDGSGASLWVDVFTDMPKHSFDQGVLQFLKESPYAPTINDLKRRCDLHSVAIRADLFRISRVFARHQEIEAERRRLGETFVPAVDFNPSIRTLS